MKYKRVPGGEKTVKSGIAWSKDELQKVYSLYIELRGSHIHERNPRIHQLASELERSARSIEAQLLMYRSLSRGKNYSHKNMNRICEEIWNSNPCYFPASASSQYNVFEKSDLSYMKVENTFLKDLLNLQQDGSRSISGPTNWMKEPILYVETDLDIEVKETLLKIDNKDKKGIWLFLIGAPGNGKSALSGKICKSLYENGHGFFTFENYWEGNNKYQYKFDESGILLPYKLEVACKTNENNNYYSICSFVQDASNIADDKEITPNGSKDIILTLDECYHKGKSLIVCANRGVLEGAKQLINNGFENYGYLNQVLDHIIKEGYSKEIIPNTTNGKLINNSIEIKSFSLENKSLFDKACLFGKLVEQACEDEKWNVCKTCSCNIFCPFYLNKKTLSFEHHKKNLLSILQQYEVYSGQTIVFREAVAIISLVLSGTSDDYIKFEGSACRWVKKMVELQNWPDLIGRRLYNTIYNPYLPYLEKKELVNDFLKRNGIPSSGHLSTNLGVKRFFKLGGIAQEIHPDLSIKTKLDHYDIEIKSIIGMFKSTKVFDGLFSDLEQNYLKSLQDIEDDVSNNDYQIIRRLMMNLISLLHYFSEGETRFKNELRDFINLNSENFDDNDKIQIKEQIENTLSELLQLKKIRINDNLEISGFDNKMRIFTHSELKIKNLNPLGLYISFKRRKNETDKINEFLFFDGKTFSFLKHKIDNNLSNITFPRSLLSQIEQDQIRIARESQYNTNSDIILEITPARGRKRTKISRIYGPIRIQEEDE